MTLLGGLTSALKPTPKHLLNPTPRTEPLYINTFNPPTRYQPRLTFIGDQRLLSRQQFHQQQARFQAQQQKIDYRQNQQVGAQRHADQRKTAERREQQKFEKFVKKEQTIESIQNQESRKLKESVLRKKAKELKRKESLLERQKGRLEEEHKLHLAGIRAAHQGLSGEGNPPGRGKEREAIHSRKPSLTQQTKPRKPSLTQQSTSKTQPFVRQSSDRSSGSSSGYGSALQRQSSAESQSSCHIYENLSNFQRGGSGRRPITANSSKQSSPQLHRRTPSINSLRSLLGLQSRGSSIHSDRWSLWSSDHMSRCSSRASIRSTDSDYQARIAQQDPYDVLQKRYFADRCFPRRTCKEYADQVCWDVGDISGVVETVSIKQYER